MNKKGAIQLSMSTIVVVVIAIVLLSLGSKAQSHRLTSTNKKAVKYYKQAETFYVQQNYVEAEIALIKSLQKDDGFIEAMFLLGDIYREQDKTLDAIP